ncbi:MAG: hypothetical protein ACOC3V_04015 [bacterium]
MKRFHEFIKENVDTDKKLTFDDFLEEIRKSYVEDFSMDDSQAYAFTNQYEDVLKDAWENGYTVREAIASTKRPGFKIEEGKIDESYILEIDELYEKYTNIIQNIQNKDNIKDYINNYYNHFNKKTFTDKRIIERIKNNYKKLIILSRKIK